MPWKDHPALFPGFLAESTTAAPMPRRSLRPVEGLGNGEIKPAACDRLKWFTKPRSTGVGSASTLLLKSSLSTYTHAVE
jgi:hypothetical protein